LKSQRHSRADRSQLNDANFAPRGAGSSHMVDHHMQIWLQPAPHNGPALGLMVSPSKITLLNVGFHEMY
jgi:hypothetical protein